MPLLDHIWPWSTIRRLRRNIQEEYRFGKTCLFMLDQVDPGVTHIRLNGELYLMGIDHCSKGVPVPNPRTNWKVSSLE